MKKFNLLFWFLCVFVLAACSKKDISSENTAETTTAATTESVEAADRNNATETKREHLGTKWGDDISSHVTEVDLKRLSNTPIAENAMRYADKDYKGRAVNSISLAAGKISFAVVDDQGNALPIYRTGDNYYLAGKDGQSYQLEYENQRNGRNQKAANPPPNAGLECRDNRPYSTDDDQNQKKGRNGL